MARDDFPIMKEQTIELKGLRAHGTHGVLPAEHTQSQEFIVDVRMEVCVEAALAHDCIDSTISYADVADAVVEIIEGPHVDLIETLADSIAQKIVALGARMVTVTVHKPQAPLPHSFTDVSATASLPGVLLEPKQRRIVLSLGSNLDVPEAHIVDAIGALSETLQIEAASELYRTAPQLTEGQEKQPDYVNAIVICHTNMPLLPFLHFLHHIEAEHGRVRTKRWEARTLDIDVIDVEGVTSKDPELLIPHPRAALRRFVLEPWASIDPTAELSGTLVSDLLDSVKDQQIERMDVDEYMPRVMEAFEQWDEESELSGLLHGDEELSEAFREGIAQYFTEGVPEDFYRDLDSDEDFWDDDPPSAETWRP